MDSKEQDFILDSWAKSQKDTKEFFLVSYAHFKVYFYVMIKNILERSEIKVLRDKKDNSVIAWICYEDNCIHYIYVKLSYRKKGYMKKLMKSAGFDGEKPFSCSFIKTWVKNKYRNKVKYKPFLRFGKDV